MEKTFGWAIVTVWEPLLQINSTWQPRRAAQPEDKKPAVALGAPQALAPCCCRCPTPTSHSCQKGIPWARWCHRWYLMSSLFIDTCDFFLRPQHGHCLVSSSTSEPYWQPALGRHFEGNIRIRPRSRWKDFYLPLWPGGRGLPPSGLLRGHDLVRLTAFPVLSS